MKIFDLDWGSGLVIRIWDWGLKILMYRLELGIGDWDLGCRIWNADCIWDWGYGYGSRIQDTDMGFGLRIGIGDNGWG